MLSFSSACVKPNEALKKKNWSISIDIGPTNHFNTEEKWKTRTVISLFITFSPIQNIFLFSLLIFFPCTGIIGAKPSAFWHALDKVDIDLVFRVLTGQICQILVVV